MTAKDFQLLQEKQAKMREQVEQFQRLELPGQPQFMHMGTSYMVRDMENLIAELINELEEFVLY